MFEYLCIGFIATLDSFLWIIDIGPSVHKFFLAPQIGNFRVTLGKIRAVRLYKHTMKHVPAYRDYMKDRPHQGPKISLGSVSLGDIPETDKANYIKKYPILDKIQYGELPKRGVMFDESSGSSGTPTSWVRGRKERRWTQRTMQVAYRKYIEDKDPIVLNTFSMGAWATGLNTTICLLGVGRVKSIGPDLTKVIDTLKELGPDFDYAIAGYPPFLKQLTDSTQINWEKYHISAIYGGEGISEEMRTSFLKYYSNVIGSYGASDLEINIATETKFTVALRKALIKDEDLRNALLKQNRGVIPMIFQYNPYDYYIETNEKGELVVTICRLDNLSPRIRYNIHDLGHAEHFYDLKKKLKALNRKDLLKLAELDFGILFHYGRSDLAVDYNGAVVGPEEIKQILDRTEKLAKRIQNFRLISYEDAHAHKHLLFALELSENQTMDKAESEQLLDNIVKELEVMNLDFKSAHSSAPLKPEIKIFENSKGLFDQQHKKLKNDYVWNIDHKRALQEDIVSN